MEGWQAALELIKNHPFRGYGFGVEDLIFKYFEYDFQVHAGAYVHNCFIGLALQLGWFVPSIFYGSLIVFMFGSYSKILKMTGQLRMMSIALYSCFVTGVINSLFEAWIYGSGGVFAFPFYVCLMLLMSLLKFHEKGLRKDLVSRISQYQVKTEERSNMSQVS